jgi:phosphatidylserine/phosphatidylglycerophosphate/cardiolipin synthase-like enzyme
MLKHTGSINAQNVEDRVKAGNVKAIKGSQHLRVLHQALGEARESICVLSGWVSSAVVDHDFERRLKAALERGVEVHQGYGWKSPDGVERSTKWEEEAKSRLSSVVEWTRRRGQGRLTIVDFGAPPDDAGNHAKLLVWDRRCAVCGSNNWLSNSKFRNNERSWMISDHAFAALCGWAPGGMVRIDRNRAEGGLSLGEIEPLREWWKRSAAQMD